MRFKFRNNFITGLLVILPLTLTIFIFIFLIKKLNFLLLDPIVRVFEPYLSGAFLEFLGKVLIFFILLFGIWAIGGLARFLIIRRAFGILEKIFLKLPIFSFIYKALKEISGAFISEDKTIFNRVVLVEYPRKGVFSIGFVTSEFQGEAQYKLKKKLISVFVPTSPTPLSGMFILVPVEEVIPLEMSVVDGMKLIVSGGAVPVPYKNKNNGDTKDRGDSS